MLRRTAGSAVAVAFALSGIACLDAGPTPVGRHLIATRSEDHVELDDGAIGAPRRIFVSSSESQAGVFGFTTRKLATVDDPGPGGGAATLRVLLDHVGQEGPACSMSGCSTPIDALGRLYLVQQTLVPSQRDPGETDEQDDLVIVDPATGAQQDLGLTEFTEISADRARVLYQPENATMVLSPVVRDLSGAEHTLTDATSPAVVGNDVFFVSGDGHLSRLAASSETVETLAPQIMFFQGYATQRGYLLQLTGMGSGVPGMYQTSIFDVSTLTETALPDDFSTQQTFVPSPSGRYVAEASESFDMSTLEMTAQLALFDRDTAQEQTASETAAAVSSVDWRPQHDEVWFVMNQNNADALWRWRPGSAPEDVTLGDPPTPPPLATVGEQELPLLSQPTFTPDGSFVFVTHDSFSQRQPVELLSADDATVEPYSLTSTGTGLSGVWPLAAGKLLVGDWLTDIDRDDIYLVDPAARTSQPLASTGHVVAVGRDRFLALLHWVAEGASGDLTLVDYATGAQTLIAQNVADVAVDVSADPDDALAPGTRVAYLVHDRIASPYDGLWVIDLP